jgi:Regulator of chromosome condensation (RCC1) repeat
MRWLGGSSAVTTIAALGCGSAPAPAVSTDAGGADASAACTAPGPRAVAVGAAACVVDCAGVLHCVDGDLAPIAAPALPPLRTAVLSRAHTGRPQLTGVTVDGRLLAAELPSPGAGTEVIELTGPTPVELVAGDSHVCGREADGAVWCWGRNDAGQLGPAVDALRGTSSPRKVIELASAAELLSAGGFTTCATTGDATRCWGQLGGPLGQVATIANLAAAVEISSGGIEGASATCARTSAGAINCTHLPGQAGPFRSIANTDDAACALAADGVVTCWGQAFDYAHRVYVDPTPTLGRRFARLAHLSTGTTFCGVTSDGEVACWGGSNWIAEPRVIWTPHG